VGWQIVSPDSGQVVYQASTEGSFSLNQPQRVATVTGLREAFGVAARNLLADPRFAAMLHSADQPRIALAY
jgi:serine protease Do